MLLPCDAHRAASSSCVRPHLADDAGGNAGSCMPRHGANLSRPGRAAGCRRSGNADAPGSRQSAGTSADRRQRRSGPGGQPPPSGAGSPSPARLRLRPGCRRRVLAGGLPKPPARRLRHAECPLVDVCRPCRHCPFRWAARPRSCACGRPGRRRRRGRIRASPGAPFGPPPAGILGELRSLTPFRSGLPILREHWPPRSPYTV